ncbi:hypothetical protein M3P05_15275 [Sansalvadorimonas sp. 2012CJ34-2]|uniref:Uncharacterized protein n=1 Tax=Parendozoicomonas callyspongiae TaxID=2942213 RepID=A0ABT0PIS2_9GAMM|nr:hypothetical protein [Sansalvadorimonas sp. 2012CJ34-2]MCL6271287.1 hypothetical protein [Sansalvadorimonas sp. 2012CJ34-2]
MEKPAEFRNQPSLWQDIQKVKAVEWEPLPETGWLPEPNGWQTEPEQQYREVKVQRGHKPLPVRPLFLEDLVPYNPLLIPFNQIASQP